MRPRNKICRVQKRSLRGKRFEIKRLGKETNLPLFRLWSAATSSIHHCQLFTLPPSYWRFVCAMPFVSQWLQIKMSVTLITNLVTYLALTTLYAIYRIYRDISVCTWCTRSFWYGGVEAHKIKGEVNCEQISNIGFIVAYLFWGERAIILRQRGTAVQPKRRHG